MRVCICRCVCTCMYDCVRVCVHVFPSKRLYPSSRLESCVGGSTAPPPPIGGGELVVSDHGGPRDCHRVGCSPLLLKRNPTSLRVLTLTCTQGPHRRTRTVRAPCTRCRAPSRSFLSLRLWSCVRAVPGLDGLCAETKWPRVSVLPAGSSENQGVVDCCQVVFVQNPVHVMCLRQREKTGLHPSSTVSVSEVEAPRSVGKLVD